MSLIRVGIAGYGLAGRYFHAPLVAATEGMALTQVVTRDPERADAARAEHAGVSVVDSVDALWDDIDLLVVATPNAVHAELADAALQRGVAVVVDKPMAVDLEAAGGLLARAAATGVALAPFHNRRWDSDMLTLRRLIDAGALGRVIRFESRFERWRPDAAPEIWRAGAPSTGGGLLLDLGTHLVDQALWLFGPPDTVYAEVATLRPGHVGEDDAFIAITHRSGVISHLRVSAMTAAPGPRLRVLGTEAAFVIDGLDGQEDALRAGRRPGDGSDWGVEPDSSWGRLLHGDPAVTTPVPSEPGDWPAFYRLMAAAILDGAPPPVNPAAAVSVLAVVEGARTSAAEARVVQIND